MDGNSSESSFTARVISRIDGPHGRLADSFSGLPDETELLVAIAGQGGELARGQLERQAEQVAARLLDTEREIDRREGAFHAQLARWEQERRSVRLLEHERQLELLAREQGLTERELRLQERLTDLAAAETQVDAQMEARDLEFRDERQAELQESIHVWRRRIEDLDLQERQLKAERGELAEARRKALEETANYQALRQEIRQRLDAERQEARSKLDAEWGALRREAERLERKRDAVHRMHADLSRLSREAMEHRLSAEEIQGRLAPLVSELELTRLTAELRRRIADEFQLAQQGLDDATAELESLRQEVKAEDDRQRSQRAELQSWFQRRQEELGRQAALLHDRERDLDAQEANHRCAEQFWDDQRVAYEQEIRRLRRLAQAA